MKPSGKSYSVSSRSQDNILKEKENFRRRQLDNDMVIDGSMSMVRQSPFLCKWLSIGMRGSYRYQREILMIVIQACHLQQIEIRIINRSRWISDPFYYMKRIFRETYIVREVSIVPLSLHHQRKEVTYFDFDRSYFLKVVTLSKELQHRICYLPSLKATCFLHNFQPG